MVYTKNAGRMQDDNLVLSDTTAAITADALATVGGAAANGIIDLGAAPVAFDVVIPISALQVTAGADILYKVQVIGSTDPAMTSAGALLGALHLGAYEMLDTGTGVVDTDSVAGNYILTCRNYTGNGTVYRYVRLNWDVAGTSASITPGGDVYIATVRGA